HLGDNPADVPRAAENEATSLGCGWDTELGEEGLRRTFVYRSRGRLIGLGPIGLGQRPMRASLVVFLPEVACEGERRVQLLEGRVVVSVFGARDAQAMPRLELAVAIADRLRQRQSLSVVLAGLAPLAEAAQRVSDRHEDEAFAWPAAHLPIALQTVAEVVDRLLVPPEAQVRPAEEPVGRRLGHP